MIESKESKTRDIPIWLTALVIVLCLGGGAWLVRWYMKETPRQVVEIPDDKVLTNGRGTWRIGGNNNNGGGNGFTRGNNTPQRDINANGIQPWGKSSFRAKTGDTIMHVNYNAKGGFDISPQYLNSRTAAQAEMAVMRMQIMQESAWREALNITDAQLKKLRDVPPPKSMSLDPADKAQLSKLWAAYHDGPADKKAAAEKDLLAGLDEVGKKNLQATKDYENTRAELVRAALTPEQIKIYQSSGGKAPVPKETPVPSVPVPAKAEIKKPGAAPAPDKTIRGATVAAPDTSDLVKTPTTKPAATAPAAPK